MTETREGTDVVERLRGHHVDAGAVSDAAAEIVQLRGRCDRYREALTDIGVYGCGMLNQPIALNEPEEIWLRRRIEEYERIARAALKEPSNG